MTVPDIRPFGDGDLDAAAVLLAERHRRHRDAEPLLPARYSEPAAARAEIEALWHSEGTSGTAALRDGRVVAYLVATRKADEFWGPNVWVDYAGHAAEEVEDVRDLYAAVSGNWVEAGRTRHYVQVPASDSKLVDAWFRIGFGAQQADGVREVGPAADVREPPAGVTLRKADPDDVEPALRVGPSLSLHQRAAPVFSQLPPPTDERLLRWWREDAANPEVGTLVADVAGRTAGLFQVCSAALTDEAAALLRPERASYLAFASVLPEARGTGAGSALLEGVLAWSREHGYEAMVTDWRVTNLLASRFWPRRGFRPAFLRLYRSIP